MLFRTRNLYWLTLLFAALIAISSGCSEEVARGLSAPANAFGKANHLIVVADRDIWESPVGDTLRYYFESAFPILPQPEPLFDLQHFTPEALQQDPIRKELRTYLLLADLNDAQSATTRLISKDLGLLNKVTSKGKKQINSRVARDKWAKGQLLIYMFAQSRDSLIQAIKNNFPAATRRIQEADRKQLWANVFHVGEAKKLQQEVRQTMGVEMSIPADYKMALNDSQTIWLRKEPEYLSSNILLHKLPYTQREQLSKEGIKALRDSLGRQYISSELNQTYSRTNDVDLPMYVKTFDQNGHFVLEARGIWEMANDFMGGPFISYLILDTQSNELLFVDGFIYAPGKKKRNYMQELELIASTIKLIGKS